MNSDDIVFVLSGGPANINPQKALGGEPSASPIVTDVLNNLFDDITDTESSSGYEDYRCFYMFNDSAEAGYTVKIWVYEDFSQSSTFELGVTSQDEIQRISIAGTPTSGTLALAYNGVVFVTNCQSDLGAWALDMQAKINDLRNSQGVLQLNGVTVSAQQVQSDLIIFDVAFSGMDGSRSHPNFTLTANNLSPTSTVSFSTLLPGSPINTIASKISANTIPPGGINFYSPGVNSPITLPKLLPSEGLPIWVKRVTTAGSQAGRSDGFTIRVSFDMLDPTVTA